MTQTPSEKLASLRVLMQKNAVDAYIIPRADDYLGEFVAPYAERLAFLTEFTGSAGFAIITHTTATVFSDGRYTLQLEQQLDGDHFTAADSVKYPLKDWLYDHMQAGWKIGFDPALHAIKQIEDITARLETKNIALKPITHNLIDQIWSDQPPIPNNPPHAFPEGLAGQTAPDKLANIYDDLRAAKQDAAILTVPDSICWLQNIRGTDIDYTPIVLTFAVVDAAAQSVKLFKPQDIAAIAASLNGKTVALDFLRAPYGVKHALENAGANIVDSKDPCIAPKARKTKAEQNSIRATHIEDGAAMVKFLHWLDKSAGQGALTELSVGEKLEQIRQQSPAYKGASFPTIAGFGANGAVIHYRASAKTNAAITDNNLLLIDSGGQYLCDDFAGTTDITRTVAIGTVSDDIKQQNTLVLKGHIALAMSKFPAGTTGAQIDTTARQALWNAGLDYAHGTGHGVGCYLAVHEEAASISPRGKDALEAGMLISNEPGYYLDGSHGIRIESLVLVQNAEICTATGTQMLQFETVTLAPIDKNLILKDLLSTEERNWLNRYHTRVFDTLAPKLPSTDRDWLQQACAPIA